MNFFQSFSDDLLDLLPPLSVAGGSLNPLQLRITQGYSNVVAKLEIYIQEQVQTEAALRIQADLISDSHADVAGVLNDILESSASFDVLLRERNKVSTYTPSHFLSILLARVDLTLYEFDHTGSSTGGGGGGGEPALSVDSVRFRGMSGGGSGYKSLDFDIMGSLCLPESIAFNGVVLPAVGGDIHYKGRKKYEFCAPTLVYILFMFLILSLLYYFQN